MYGMMGVSMWGSGGKIKHMELECIAGVMEEYTRVNGKVDSCMALESFVGVMERGMRGSGRMGKNMELGIRRVRIQNSLRIGGNLEKLLGLGRINVIAFVIYFMLL